VRIAGWNDAGSPLSIGDAEATWRRCHRAMKARLPNPPLTTGSSAAIFNDVAFPDCTAREFTNASMR